MLILFADETNDVCSGAGLWADVPGHSPGKPVDRGLCQAATTLRDTYLPQKIPLANTDCALHVGIDYSPALFTNIETAMHMAELLPCVTRIADLACVVLLYFYNPKAFGSSIIHEKLDDPFERPMVKLLAPAFSPVLALLMSLRFPRRSRDTASIFRDLSKLESRWER